MGLSVADFGLELVQFPELAPGEVQMRPEREHGGSADLFLQGMKLLEGFMQRMTVRELLAGFVGERDLVGSDGQLRVQTNIGKQFGDDLWIELVRDVDNES